MEVPVANSGDSWVGMVRTVLRRYLGFFRRFWWVVLLCLAIGVLAAGLITARQPMVYVSSARMMVSGKIALNEGAVYSEEFNNFFGTQMELMRSDEVRRRAADRLRVLRPDLQPQSVFIDVSLLPKTAIFILRATGATPEYTQRFLDACMDEYIATKKEMRSEKSETTYTAIRDELGRLEKEIRQGEEELLEGGPVREVHGRREGPALDVTAV